MSGCPGRRGHDLDPTGTAVGHRPTRLRRRRVRSRRSPIEPVRGLATGDGRRTGFVNNCLIDFNESSVLASLPDQAITTDVEWPYWNQYCPALSDTAIAVQPVGASHYHLGYVDETIMW